MSNVNQKDLDTLATLNDRIEDLKKEMKPISDRVKAAMIADGADFIQHNGHDFAIVETPKNTCKDKQGFVAFLVGKDLKNCVDMITEPNIDRARSEAQSTNGKITMTEFNAYVTRSVSRSLKVSK